MADGLDLAWSQIRWARAHKRMWDRASLDWWLLGILASRWSWLDRPNHTDISPLFSLNTDNGVETNMNGSVILSGFPGRTLAFVVAQLQDRSIMTPFLS